MLGCGGVGSALTETSLKADLTSLKERQNKRKSQGKERKGEGWGGVAASGPKAFGQEAVIGAP